MHDDGLIRGTGDVLAQSSAAAQARPVDVEVLVLEHVDGQRSLGLSSQQREEYEGAAVVHADLGQGHSDAGAPLPPIDEPDGGDGTRCDPPVDGLVAEMQRVVI